MTLSLLLNVVITCTIQMLVNAVPSSYLFLCFVYLHIIWILSHLPFSYKVNDNTYTIVIPCIQACVHVFMYGALLFDCK